MLLIWLLYMIFIWGGGFYLIIVYHLSYWLILLMLALSITLKIKIKGT